MLLTTAIYFQSTLPREIKSFRHYLWKTHHECRDFATISEYPLRNARL